MATNSHSSGSVGGGGGAPPTSTSSSLTSRMVSVLFLLVALVVLQDEAQKRDDTATNSRWAVWVALRKHPPSLRIFRSLLEWNLLVWCTVVSLALWYQHVGEHLVSELLFSPAIGGLAGASSSRHVDYRDGDNLVDDRFQFARSTNTHSSHLNDSSEIVFTEHDASFSEVMTGADEGHTLEHKESFASFKDEQRQKVVDKDEEEEDSSPSSFDAQIPSHAPSVHHLTRAALDMLLPTLLALFFFTLLSTETKANYVVDPRLSWLAPLVPLLLVAYLITTQILLKPWKPIRHFCTVLGWTMGAPLFPVTFRDGFIGDVFTSTVRPMQDVMFTLCYIFSGFQGFFADGYEGFWDSVNHNPHGLNDDDDNAAAEALVQATIDADTNDTGHSSLLPPLPTFETSWMLHTFLLPMCMVSPLWWRFLQNLRQTHDTKRRWPYLGNGFKYLLAAEVAMFGVFDPSKQETFLWLGWFVVTTLYQVWWDVFMDWELLVPNHNHHNYDASNSGLLRRWWSWCCRYQLREQRLFPSKVLYLAIFAVNFVLRFGWTLSFLPPRYLNQAGVLSDTFQHSDWSRALAPAIASAEIIRRTLWGWIRLENEAIKVMKEQQQQQQQQGGGQSPLLPSPQKLLELQYRGDDPEQAFGDVLDGMEPMMMDGMSSSHQRWDTRQGIIPAMLNNLKSMEGNSEVQILAELSLWAAVFATLGMIAAAHRMTL